MDMQVVKEAARDRKAVGSRHKPYPKEVKEFVIEHVKEALAAGESINALSQDLEISANTLTAWISPNGNKEPTPRGRRPKALPVIEIPVTDLVMPKSQVTSAVEATVPMAEPNKCRLVVRGNTAEYAVENLTRDDVIFILRSLS